MQTENKSINKQETSEHKRAVIYVRVAAQPQETMQGENALLTQQEHCKQYCEKHGYRVIRIFQEVYSGAKYDERPELSLLRTAAQWRAFDVVVVSSYDRLSRKPEHLEALIKESEQSGVSIISVTEHDGVAALMKDAQALVADIQRDRLRKRLAHGKQQRKQQPRLSGE